MSPFEFRLLNDFQRGFPLCERPFLAIAQTLGCAEDEVIAALLALRERGLSRVGAVFRPGTIGVSTLAAMAVPTAQLDRVAALVTGFGEVNHNYEREHRFNLWFVVTAADRAHLEATLRAIGAAARVPVMSLPLEREYRIDLGFDLRQRETGAPAGLARALDSGCACNVDGTVPQKRPPDPALIAALQGGLALTPRPYRELADRAGLSEQEVIDRVGALIAQGAIKRFGVVVRHRDLGYVANAMAVFDVADDAVDGIGERIAESGLATLCYRRTRRLPDWPYNLFCMIHGRARVDTARALGVLRERCALEPYRHAVLFSRQCFKQRGAHYAPAVAAAHG